MNKLEKILLATSFIGVSLFLIDLYRRHIPIYHNIDDNEPIRAIDFLILNIKRLFMKNDYNNTTVTPIKPQDKNDLEIIPIGHSTVLIQLDGKNILTDPVFDNIICNSKIRYKEPCIKFEDLPKIDIILLSHNHCDHFDINTLKELENKFKPVFIVPMGNKDKLLKHGINNVQEINWWQSLNLLNIDIIFVPSQHYSGRFLHYNQTLWGGYVLKSVKGNVYFAGDTGIGSHFKLIHEKFDNFDYCLLPVSPMTPENMFKDTHLNPEQAQAVHKELNCKTSIPIHYGTFRQGNDKQNDIYDKFKDLDNFKIQKDCKIYNTKVAV